MGSGFEEGAGPAWFGSSRCARLQERRAGRLEGRVMGGRCGDRDDRRVSESGIGSEARPVCAGRGCHTGVYCTTVNGHASIRSFVCVDPLIHEADGRRGVIPCWLRDIFASR